MPAILHRGCEAPLHNRRQHGVAKLAVGGPHHLRLLYRTIGTDDERDDHFAISSCAPELPRIDRLYLDDGARNDVHLERSK